MRRTCANQEELSPGLFEELPDGSIDSMSSVRTPHSCSLVWEVSITAVALRIHLGSFLKRHKVGIYPDLLYQKLVRWCDPRFLLLSKYQLPYVMLWIELCLLNSYVETSITNMMVLGNEATGGN